MTIEEFIGAKSIKEGIKLSLIKYSLDILNEDPATSDHATRVRLAKAVLKGDGPTIEKVIFIYATNPTLVAYAKPELVPQSDIDFVTTTLIGNIATVFYGE